MACCVVLTALCRVVPDVFLTATDHVGVVVVIVCVVVWPECVPDHSMHLIRPRVPGTLPLLPFRWSDSCTLCFVDFGSRQCLPDTLWVPVPDQPSACRIGSV